MERNIKISRWLSKYLRHTPEEIGLKLQPGGWVSVDDLLTACTRARFPVTYDELVEVVETNDKQRFSFSPDLDLIRANQGHSVEVDLQLEEAVPPSTLYHGTVEKFMEPILAEGLKKGKRHHVHLSKDLATATKVGSRRGRPVILTVDAGRMYGSGYKFYRSTNGVWLTDEVPPHFLARQT